MELVQADFAAGGLQRVSYARPAKLFTAHASLISATAGELDGAAHLRVCNALIALLLQGEPEA